MESAFEHGVYKALKYPSSTPCYLSRDAQQRLFPSEVAAPVDFILPIAGEVKPEKAALNYQTFFIVRALQPNIIPVTKGWKSILST